MSESIDTVVEQVGSPAVEDGLEVQNIEQDANVGDPVAEGEEGLDAASQSEQLEEEIRELKKKLKLKVNGEEIEEEIDFNDDEDLTRRLQKAKAFDRKAQEYSELQKQAEELVYLLQNDPRKLLEVAGHDVDQLAETVIANKLENMKKSPEQIQYEEALQAREELEARLKQIEEEKTSIENERLLEQQAAQIENDILTGLDNSETILSKEDPEIIGDIARTMYRIMAEGDVNVTVEDVVPLVEKRYINKLQKRLELVDDGALEKIIGKNTLERLRKKRLSRKKKGPTTTAKQVKDTGVQVPKEEPKPEKIKMKDYFKPY